MPSTESELDSIHPIWLITGVVIFPFMVYQLLGFLSPLIHNLTAMRISQVFSTKPPLPAPTNHSRSMCIR
jgi:hypothetical protein